MKYNLTVNRAQTVEEVPEYWTNEDYVQLLLKFNYPDAEKADKDTLPELLLMAITDFDPPEAAATLLEYKLADQLSEGQIQQISHDMLVDKVAEEYPAISLHATLFHINQLLFKAFNGKFPSTKATLINLTIRPAAEAGAVDLTKASILRLLANGLADRNLIKRLFAEQLGGGQAFPEAESILWEVRVAGDRNYTILTSDYWLSKDDLVASEFAGSLAEEQPVEENN